MPFLFWLGLGTLGFCALVGTSLLLTTLAAGTRRGWGARFASFAALTAAWAVAGLGLKFALWQDSGGARTWLELGVLLYALLGPAVLTVAARCAQERTRVPDLAALAGLLATAAMAVPLFRHRILSGPLMAADGTIRFSLYPAALAAGSIPVGCLLWSLWLLLRRRRKPREPFVVAGVLVQLAALGAGALLRTPLPLVPLGNALAVSLLGYAAMRRQLLDPMKATAEALQERARRLELIAGIGQRATAILQLDELLHQAVALIRKEFAYFNVSIFLVDRAELVLRASASRPELENRMRLAIGREGICGQVARTGEPLLVPDVGRSPHYLRLSQGVLTRSELAVPIKLGGRVIGVLDAQSSRLAGFAPVDLFTLQTIADQLAIAIENARLYAETRRRAERLAVVNRVAAAAGATLRLDDLLATVYREVAPVFRADAFFIALYDEPAGELDFRFQLDESKLEPPNRQALGGGLSSWVVRNRRPLLIRDFEQERPALPVPDLWGSMKLPASWLGVPMRLGERVTGVISVQAYRPRAYGEEEQQLLLTIADQVAVAVENARLFEAAQSEIGERRVAEQVLRESEEKFRNLAEQSPNMIFINRGGQVVYANRRCEELMGYTREEFYAPGFDFRILVAPEHRGIIQQEYEKHLRGEEVPPYEYTLLARDGRRMECILASGLLRFGDQNAIMGIITDITTRKRSERLLASLNAAGLAMARVLDPEKTFSTAGGELSRLGLSSMVFLADPDGLTLRLAYSSHDPQKAQAAELLLGGPAREFAFDIESSEQIRRVMRERCVLFLEAEEAIRQALPGPLKAQAAAMVRALQTRWAIEVPLIVEEKVVGLLAVHSADLGEQDVPAITAFANQIAASWQKSRLMQDLERSLRELQRTQGELIQAQKMEAIGRLAGGIAHDFNNLLTAIGGYTQLLLERFPGPDPAHADLVEIKKATGRAGALTRQLLAFSRKQVLQPRLLDLNEVILNMEKMLRRLLGDHIELVASLAPGLGGVKADPLQLEQVIMNLAINGADAMPGGGRLILETGNVELEPGLEPAATELRPGSYVLLAVSDNGVGMDSDIQGRLFEPFFTTKPPGKGTGLGLSTVYGIVAQSGGYIQAYSRPGFGSCFKVYLQRVPDADRPPPASRPAEGSRGGETVLLVEEEAGARDLMRTILAARGYAVLEADPAQLAPAEGPKPAVQVQVQVHLAICDVILPGQTGAGALAGKLASRHPGVRLLFVSGYTAGALRKNGLLPEGARFLPRPFGPQALARAVREALDCQEDG
jgi:PAS domain S-box-containing protein